MNYYISDVFIKLISSSESLSLQIALETICVILHLWFITKLLLFEEWERPSYYVQLTMQLYLRYAYNIHIAEAAIFIYLLYQFTTNL